MNVPPKAVAPPRGASGNSGSMNHASQGVGLYETGMDRSRRARDHGLTSSVCEVIQVNRRVTTVHSLFISEVREMKCYAFGKRCLSAAPFGTYSPHLVQMQLSPPECSGLNIMHIAHQAACIDANMRVRIVDA